MSEHAILKLPLRKEKGLIGGGWMILDNDGKILSHIGAPAFAQRRIVTEDEIDSLITACNEHAKLKTEVERLRDVLSECAIRAELSSDDFKARLADISKWARIAVGTESPDEKG